jgi:hypothetical protein
LALNHQAAHGAATEAERRNRQACLTQFTLLHAFMLVPAPH